MKLSVVIPCFNESATIEAVVHSVLSAPLPKGWEKEVIVVDDGSDMATQEALRRLGPGGIVTRNERNGGKGAAVQAGLKLVSGDYILIQDADLEYDPHEYETLVQPLVERKADSVFGSRTLTAGNTRGARTFFWGGIFATKLFNLLFGTRFSDIATCYKVFPRDYIPALLSSHHKDFVFDAVDLTYALAMSGSVAEVPISYRARDKEHGKKLNWKQGIKIVLCIVFLRLGIRTAQEERTALQVARFLVAGTAAALINIGSFYLLSTVGRIWYVVASGIAFLIAFSVNFFLQKYWTFQSKEHARMKHQLPLQFLVSAFNLFANIAIVYVLVADVGLLPLLAQTLASIAIAFESFFVFRWVFK